MPPFVRTKGGMIGFRLRLRISQTPLQNQEKGRRGRWSETIFGALL